MKVTVEHVPVVKCYPNPDAKSREELFGRKPTFKNIRTLTEQDVESLKHKQSIK